MELELNALSLVSSAELIEELKKRHTAVLVCVMDHHENTESIRTAFSGGKYCCIGMARYFEAEALSDDTVSEWKREE